MVVAHTRYGSQCSLSSDIWLCSITTRDGCFKRNDACNEYYTQYSLGNLSLQRFSQSDAANRIRDVYYWYCIGDSVELTFYFRKGSDHFPINLFMSFTSGNILALDRGKKYIGIAYYNTRSKMTMPV